MSGRGTRAWSGSSWRGVARLIATGALIAAGAAGCAGPRGLHGLAPAPDPARLRRALAPFGRVEATAAPAQAAAAVWLVARDPVRLAVYDLRRRDFRFIVRADVASRVVVGRGFGAFARDEGRSIAAFDNERGRELWQQPTPRAGWRALGLAASAERVVVVWGHRGPEDVPPGSARGAPQATIVAYDGRSGERQWALPSWVRVGEPSAWRDQLVLPIQRQGLAVLRARDGQVVAQLPWRGEAIAWTEANRDGVFFGGRVGVHRLGPATTGGMISAPPATVAALPAIDGVSPVWGRRAYDGAPWDYGAGDRQRWLWRRPASPPHGASGWADDRLVLLHYRFLLGFALDRDDRQRLRLAWVRRGARADFVAATHTGRALALVGADGELVVVDPLTGHVRQRAELGLPLRGATFDAEGWGAGVTGATPPASAGDLRDGLLQALVDPDRRFPGLARYFLAALVKSPGPPPTAALVRLTRDPRWPPELREQATDALNERPDEHAAALYLSLLAERNDYVLGTRALSVELAARAVGALQLPEAVRPLLLQLADPQTPVPTLAVVVAALWSIGDRSAKEPLRELLLTYRCDPELAWAPQILSTAAAAVLEWGGSAERALVTFVAQDPHTVPALRQRLDRLLSGDTDDEAQ